MKYQAIAIVLAGLTSVGAVLGLAPGSAPSAPPPTGAYTVDPVHSTLVFKITHNSGTFFGRFNKMTGKFLLDPADLSGSLLEFQVDTNSIDTAAEKRDTHLRSPDFFNVKQFPTATFKSTSIKKTGEGAFEVAGDLTVSGMTKPVTVKVASARKGPNPQQADKENAGFEATFSVKRGDFGIDKFQGMLGEDVTVMVGVEGNR